MEFFKRSAACLTGLVFIVSSVLKLMDPVGTGLIMESYFQFLHIEFLRPAAKVLGELLSGAEGLVGIGLVTGVYRRFFAICTWVLLGIFTIISAILVIFNPDMDCGCFGQAVHLTHFQTLMKNIILLGLSALAFIPTYSLGYASTHKVVVFYISIALLAAFSLISWLQVPLVDFAEFRPSHTIVAENDIKEDSFEYPTLTLLDEDGNDCSDAILDGHVMLISVYAPEKLDWKRISRLATFAQDALNAGFTPVTVSTAMVDIPGVDCYLADYKKLITLNRNNGGVTFLYNGYIIRKRSFRSLLSYEKMDTMVKSDATEAYVTSGTDRSLILQGFLILFIALMLLG